MVATRMVSVDSSVQKFVAAFVPGCRRLFVVVRCRNALSWCMSVDLEALVGGGINQACSLRRCKVSVVQSPGPVSLWVRLVPHCLWRCFTFVCVSLKEVDSSQCTQLLSWLRGEGTELWGAAVIDQDV